MILRNDCHLILYRREIFLIFAADYCNNTFGKGLDQSLGRGGYEGFMRFSKDEERQRAYTKIAINYLVKVCEGKFENIIFSDDLLPAKKLVISGTFPGYQIVLPSAPIYAIDEEHNTNKTDGHLLAIGIYDNAGKNQIVCQISIYNQLTQAVILCPEYKGIVLPINSGHHWSLTNRECRKVLVVEKRGQMPARIW